MHPDAHRITAAGGDARGRRPRARFHCHRREQWRPVRRLRVVRPALTAGDTGQDHKDGTVEESGVRLELRPGLFDGVHPSAAARPRLREDHRAAPRNCDRTVRKNRSVRHEAPPVPGRDERTLPLACRSRPVKPRAA